MNLMLYIVVKIRHNVNIQGGITMKIKNMRKQKGFYQKYVASQLGICARHYQRIESGIQKPSEKQLLLLSKLFGCKMSQICD